MKKKLIFVFRVFNGMFDNRGIQLHLNCLKYYCDIFDEVMFVLQCDNIEENHNEIIETEKRLMSFGYRNITFKITNVNYFYESQTLYDEVVSKMKDLSGSIVFFGHTKGITNYGRGFKKDNIDSWIEGLYFLNLCNIKDVEDALIRHSSLMYGAFLTKDDYGYIYAGTFYWINCGKFLVYKKEYKDKPVDRWYGERITSEIGLKAEDETLTSLDCAYVFSNTTANIYANSDKQLKFLLGSDEERLKEFDKFKSTVENGLIEVN